MKYQNLAELAKTAPNLNVTISLGELIEAVEHCVSTTQRNLEQIISDEATEKYLKVEKTAELLDVDKSTLWRWNKSG